MTKKAIIGELVSKEVAMAQEATATFVEGITFSSAAIDANVDQDEVVHCPNGVPNLEAEAGDYTSVADRIATSQKHSGHDDLARCLDSDDKQSGGERIRMLLRTIMTLMISMV